MDGIVRKLSARPSLVLGTVLLLGVFEFVALQRSQRMSRQLRDASETART